MCQYKSILGVDCPGCGLTRAFQFMLEGEWISAWQMHPAIYFIALFVFFGFLQWLKPGRIIKFLMLVSLFATISAEVFSFIKNLL